MHPQLEILLQIQDLKSQRGDLAELAPERAVEAEQFNLDVDAALAQLDGKIGDLENELETPVRRRYDRVKAARGRIVAPVVNGTCYGCFVSLPTADSSQARAGTALESCDNCGRFIYFPR